MTKLEPLERLLTSLMEEFDDDHVGLWSVVKQVRREFPTDDPDAIRSKTLSVIQFLLRMGYIDAGFPTKDGRGFDPWRMKPDHIIKNIETEWIDSQPDPTIGEVVWFTSPT